MARITLDEIDTMWDKDKNIDYGNLESELINIPTIHHRFYRILVNERLILKNLNLEYDVLLKDKREYYVYGPVTKPKDTDVKKLPRGAVLKTEASLYVNADDDIILLSKKIAEQEQKVEYLNEIIKQINSRNFIIKEISTLIRFKEGVR